LHVEEEEEEDYKLWPANKSDRSWQSLSNPALMLRQVGCGRKRLLLGPR